MCISINGGLDGRLSEAVSDVWAKRMRGPIAIVQHKPLEDSDKDLYEEGGGAHLKYSSLNVKCVSTMPVVFTRVLNTSC